MQNRAAIHSQVDAKYGSNMCHRVNVWKINSQCESLQRVELLRSDYIVKRD